MPPVQAEEKWDSMEHPARPGNYEIIQLVPHVATPPQDRMKDPRKSGLPMRIHLLRRSLVLLSYMGHMNVVCGGLEAPRHLTHYRICLLLLAVRDSLHTRRVFPSLLSAGCIPECQGMDHKRERKQQARYRFLTPPPCGEKHLEFPQRL